jgi:hypothetical protein
MSRHGATTRTRYRMPSMSCSLLHPVARPDRVGLGNNGSQHPPTARRSGPTVW